MPTSRSNKKTEGSPIPHASRADRSARPHRVPMSGNRDILVVLNKDPDFFYRWFKDTGHNGQRIYRAKQAAYDFVDATVAAEHGVGQDLVYNAGDVGSLIRVPAGHGEYLYLMRIRREYYEEDKAAEQSRIDELERQITRERDPERASDDGQYGSIKLT